MLSSKSRQRAARVGRRGVRVDQVVEHGRGAPVGEVGVVVHDDLRAVAGRMIEQRRQPLVRQLRRPRHLLRVPGTCPGGSGPRSAASPASPRRSADRAPRGGREEQRNSAPRGARKHLFQKKRQVASSSSRCAGITPCPIAGAAAAGMRARNFSSRNVSSSGCSMGATCVPPGTVSISEPGMRVVHLFAEPVRREGVVGARHDQGGHVHLRQMIERGVLAGVLEHAEEQAADPSTTGGGSTARSRPRRTSLPFTSRCVAYLVRQLSAGGELPDQLHRVRVAIAAASIIDGRMIFIAFESWNVSSGSPCEPQIRTSAGTCFRMPAVVLERHLHAHRVPEKHRLRRSRRRSAPPACRRRCRRNPTRPRSSGIPLRPWPR